MYPIRAIARRFPSRRFYSGLQTESSLRYNVEDKFDINAALRSQKRGIGLEQPFYNNPSVYQRDLERVWHRNWLFAGFSTQIRSPGEFFTYQVGDENVIVIRGDDKKIRAFHNVCRHRGSRICTKESGKVLNLTCPYHAWTYSKKGECIKAPQVGDQIDISQKSLVNAQIQEVNGLIFISFSDNPPNFEPARQLLAPQLRLHRLEDAKIAYVTNDTVKANWKIIYENNRECYHCATTHPEYIRSNYDLAFSYTWDKGSEKARRIPDPKSPKYQEAIEHTKYCQDLWEEKYGLACTVDNSFPGEGWYRASRAPLKKGWVNESLDGKALGPILGDFEDRELGTLRIHVLPNFWIHVSSDYACSARLTPIDRFHTHIQTTWLVHQDVNVNEDFLSRLLPFWQKTNDADWRLCEANMAGIMSSRYQPPEFLLSKESGIQNFLWWYTQQIGDKAPNPDI